MTRLPPPDMKPIGTAPKDGTRIVVWRENYGLYNVVWVDGAWSVRVGRPPLPTAEVTRWMPVPPPPTGAEILGITEEEYARLQEQRRLEAEAEEDD